MKRILIALPMLGLLAISACSEDAPKTVAKEEKVITPPKPLIERDADVRDYFDTMNEMIDAYIAVGETMLTTLEQLDSGKLGYLESAAAAQGLLESWSKIEAMTTEMQEHEDIKKTIESKLNPKDVLEFTQQFEDVMARLKALTDRMEESSLNKYITF